MRVLGDEDVHVQAAGGLMPGGCSEERKEAGAEVHSRER